MKRERNAKQAFIEGTVRVVARDGLDKTTTKAIATEAGLSEAYIFERQSIILDIRCLLKTVHIVFSHEGAR